MEQGLIFFVIYAKSPYKRSNTKGISSEHHADDDNGKPFVGCGSGETGLESRKFLFNKVNHNECLL